MNKQLFLNEDKRDLYVYGHIRSDNNEMFYIGLGRGNRKSPNGKRNIFWHRVYNKCNKDIKVVVFKDGLTLKEACELEIKLILKYGRSNLGKGTLVNLTDGGEGTKNIIVTHEKAKRCAIAISKALKARYSKINHHSKGLKMTGDRLIQQQELCRNLQKTRIIDYSKISGLNAVQSKGIIYQYCKNTGELIGEYESTGLAEKATGIHSGRICEVINGRRNQAKGFIFKR